MKRKVAWTITTFLALITLFLFYSVVQGAVLVRVVTEDPISSMEVNTPDGWKSMIRFGESRVAFFFVSGDQNISIRWPMGSEYRFVRTGYATSGEIEYIRINIEDQHINDVVTSHFP